MWKLVSAPQVLPALNGALSVSLWALLYGYALLYGFIPFPAACYPPPYWLYHTIPQTWNFLIFSLHSWFMEIREWEQKCSMIVSVHRWITQVSDSSLYRNDRADGICSPDEVTPWTVKGMKIPAAASAPEGTKRCRRNRGQERHQEEPAGLYWNMNNTVCRQRDYSVLRALTGA